MKLSGLLKITTPKYRPLLVVLVVIASLAVPPARNVLFMQSHMYMRDDDEDTIPPFWTGGEQVVPRNASDALYIASSRAEETSGESYWRMADRYPEEPSLYAGVLRYYMGSEKSPLSHQNLELKTRADRQRAFKTTTSGTSTLKTLEKAMLAVSRGRELDPNNAYYDLSHAYLLYVQGRDAEASQVVRQASLQKRYDSYIDETLDTHISYGMRPVFPIDRLCPAWKIAVKSSIDYGHLARFRSVNRLTVWNLNPNNPQRMLESTADLFHIGTLVSKGTESYLEVTVGSGFQRNALDCSRRILQGQPPQISASHGNRQRPTTHYYISQLQKVAGRHLPDAIRKQWEAEGEQTDALHKQMLAYTRSKELYDSILKPSVIAWTGAKLYLAIFWIGFFWFVAWIWLAARRKLDLVNLGPSPLMLWLAILLPALPARYPLTGMQYFSPVGALLLQLAVGVAVTAVPVTLIVTVLRTRMAEGVGRLDTFAARLRRACAMASVGLLTIYVLSVVGNFVVAKQVMRDIDQVCSGEITYVRSHTFTPKTPVTDRK